MNQAKKKTRADIDAAIKAQADLCAKDGLPHFAPRNGVCWSCHRSIYEGAGAEDGKTFITGCPHCHRSYCD